MEEKQIIHFIRNLSPLFLSTTSTTRYQQKLSRGILSHSQPGKHKTKISPTTIMSHKIIYKIFSGQPPPPALGKLSAKRILIYNVKFPPIWWVALYPPFLVTLYVDFVLYWSRYPLLIHLHPKVEGAESFLYLYCVRGDSRTSPKFSSPTLLLFFVTSYNCDSRP